MCPNCNDTGIIETGNNDLPCQCPAGDKAIFSGMGGDLITGVELRRQLVQAQCVIEGENTRFNQLGTAARRIALLHSGMSCRPPIFEHEQARRDYEAYMVRYKIYRVEMGYSDAARLAFGETIEEIIRTNRDE